MKSLVLVSHSEQYLTSLAEVLDHLVLDVPLALSTNAFDGCVGTDPLAILTAIRSIAGVSDNIMILTEGGSAYVNAQAAIDLADEINRDRLHLIECSLADSAVMAALMIQEEHSVEEIIQAIAQIR